jgi:hypothetical protein
VAAITQFEDLERFGKIEEIENGILAEAFEALRGESPVGQRGRVTRCSEMGGSRAQP